VFEIGNSLREARLRQGLDFPRIEAETKIRAKYLRALEEESFEALPGDTYVKGFLRTYADYLGLDGQLYVDEFNSRFTAVEEIVVTPTAPRRKRPGPSESNLIVVALAGIVAVTVLVVVGLTGLGGGSPEETPLVQTNTTPTGAPSKTGSSRRQSKPPHRHAKKAKLVLTAARGDCWMQVRAGGVNGRLLYEGTLEQGQTQRFAKYPRVWIELGNPANLTAKLNGKKVAFPTAEAVVLVDVRGVHTLSTSG
jgi:cytoskeleton protein RodZ